MKKELFTLILIMSMLIFTVYGKGNIVPQKIRIIESSGTSQFRLPNSDKWNLIKMETQLKMGWDIKTLKDSKIKLGLEPTISAALTENSLLRLHNLIINPTQKTIRMRMHIQTGLLFIEMPSYLGYKLLFTIETPSATIYLRNAVLKIYVENNITTLEVLRGAAKIRHNRMELKTIIYSDSRVVVHPYQTTVNISKLTDKEEERKKEQQSYISVAILSIKSKVVTKENLEPVSDYIAQEIEKQSNTEVLFLDDVRSLLSAEGVQDILDCTTDSCISRIGSFLGVDMVVIGKLGQLGKKYMFNLKMIDVLRDKTLKRVSTTVDNDMGLILNKVPNMVDSLIAENIKRKEPKAEISKIDYVPDSVTRPKILRGMEWIFPGTFVMGSEVNEGDMDEWPQHKVTLDGFYIDKYEAIKEEFERVMGYNPSGFKGCKSCPVDNVSWSEAREYCNKVNKRLPTEAEWEYACRAGTKTVFYYGNTLSSDRANFNGKKPFGGTPQGIFRNKTLPVGSLKSNAWNLYDMHGNVWEWCADWYNEAYYGNSTEKNPKGPKKGKYKVLRGGSWKGDAASLRSANRISYSPSIRLKTNGFRCVKDSY